MIKRDVTVAELARLTGYSRPHLSGVINGRYESMRAKKVIALALGKKFKEIWDDKPPQA